MNIVDRYHLMPSVELDCEDYYDYQILRPVRRVTDSEATITWPTTTLWQGLDEDQPVVCVTGPEPNLRWRRYCADLIEKFARLDPAGVVVLGAMISDVPHTRPLPVSGAVSDAQMASRLGIDEVDYEGPVGLPSVLVEEVRKSGTDAMGLWAFVPQYAFEPPCPPAVLALLLRVEELTGLALVSEELRAQSQQWVEEVSQEATQTEGRPEYIRDMEQEQDADLPEGLTGAVLAVEFQSYLRNRKAERQTDSRPRTDGDDSQSETGPAGPQPPSSKEDPPRGEEPGPDM